MTFAPARAFRNLRTLVFRNHSLELQQQLVLWGLSRRRFEKDYLYSATRQLLDQENLISILSAEAVWRMNENCFELSAGGQIAQRF